MEINLNTQSNYKVKIFDRNDSTCPGYFKKIGVKDFKSYIQNLINTYQNLFSKSILNRIIKSLKKEEKLKCYSVDLFKMMSSIKLKNSEEEKRSEFQSLFNKIVSSLKYENSTTSKARYIFKLKVETLKNIKELSHFDEFEENIYMNQILNIGKEHKNIVVDLKHLASIFNHIPNEKKNKIESKVQIAVQRYEWMTELELKVRNFSKNNMDFLYENPSIEKEIYDNEETILDSPGRSYLLDNKTYRKQVDGSGNKHQKIDLNLPSKIIMNETYLSDDEEHLNNDKTYLEFKKFEIDMNDITSSSDELVVLKKENLYTPTPKHSIEIIAYLSSSEDEQMNIELNSNRGFEEEQKIKSKSDKKKGDQSRPVGDYVIVDREDLTFCCSFQTIHLTQSYKKILTKILNGCEDINENVKSRIQNQMQKTYSPICYNSADIWILLICYLLNTNGKIHDPAISELYELSRKSLLKEMETTSEVRYIFKVRLDTIEKFLKLSKKSEDVSVIEYFKEVVNKENNKIRGARSKKDRRCVVVDMEQFAKFFDMIEENKTELGHLTSEVIERFTFMKAENNSKTIYKTYFSKDFLNTSFENNLKKLQELKNSKTEFSTKEISSCNNESSVFLKSIRNYKTHADEYLIIDRYDPNLLNPCSFQSVRMYKQSLVTEILNNCMNINGNVKNRIETLMNKNSKKSVFKASDIWLLVNYYLLEHSNEQLSQQLEASILWLYEASRKPLLNEVIESSEVRYIFKIQLHVLKLILEGIKSEDFETLKSAPIPYLKAKIEKEELNNKENGPSTTLVIDMEQLAILFNDKKFELSCPKNLDSNIFKNIKWACYNKLAEMKRKGKDEDGALYKKYFSLNFLNTDFNNKLKNIKKSEIINIE